MVYDPFASAASTNASSGEEVQNRFVSVRRPPILNANLRSLEWSDGRKRRADAPEPVPSPGAVTPRGSRSVEQQPTNSSQPGSVREVVREVVRVVEKVVYAEPVTIMGGAPLVDDRIRTVVNFILEHVQSPGVEVEAKLGFLYENQENMRAIHLVPVTCETPISKESNKDTRFVSDVGEGLFLNLNDKLNKRVEATVRDAEGRVEYLQKKEVDVMYPGRVRETRAIRPRPNGTEGYETIRVESKKRLGDLNMLCPGRVADIRYSASLEQKAEIPHRANPIRQRSKDRISYKYEYLSIDVTSVDTHEEALREPTRTYEVEVEIEQSANLYEEVMKYRNGDGSSKLFDIVTSLVNTVRILLEE